MPYAFPLSVQETYLKDKPQSFVNWHYHEELQVIYVLEGEITLAVQGGSYTVSAGEAIFVNANIGHMARSQNPQAAHILSLHFQPSILSLYHGSIIEQKYVLPFINDPMMQTATFSPDNPGEKSFLNGMKALFSAVEREEFGYELVVYSILLGLWKFLLDHTGDHKRRTQPKENAQARDMLLYLQEHYAERISLEELAELSHISKSASCRLFRAAYGCSPFAYLIDYRLQQSILLLRDETLSVAQVAERCGFNSTSYFIKTFREKIGLTPLQYRLSGQ